MKYLILLFLVTFVGCVTKEKPEIAPEKETILEPLDWGSFDSTSVQLMNLINFERVRQGLSLLVFSTPLVCAADAHANDIGPKKICSHVGSDGSSFISRIKRCGVTYYSRAGEIIACGQKTPADAVRAWMNSSGHRNIILTRGYNNLGCGYYGATKYWVCVFTQL